MRRDIVFPHKGPPQLPLLLIVLSPKQETRACVSTQEEATTSDSISAEQDGIPGADVMAVAPPEMIALPSLERKSILISLSFVMWEPEFADMR